MGILDSSTVSGLVYWYFFLIENGKPYLKKTVKFFNVSYSAASILY